MKKHRFLILLLICLICIGTALSIYFLRQRTARVPILMYHAFAEDAEGVAASTYVSAPAFEAQLKALKESGYHSVTLAQLEEFVRSGAKLPAKPIVITIDDGYLSNLTIAAPLLEKYGFCATIAAIGCSVGKTTYKDTDSPIIPHFSLQEALPWVEKGTLEVISHTYDMHQVLALDGEDCRISVEQMPGESDADYEAALIADFTKSRQQLESGLGQPITALAYPNGRYTETSERVFRNLGVEVTMTIKAGTNVIKRNDPESLRLLRRNWITDDMSGEDLVTRIRTLKNTD